MRRYIYIYIYMFFTNDYRGSESRYRIKRYSVSARGWEGKNEALSEEKSSKTD